MFPQHLEQNELTIRSPMFLAVRDERLRQISSAGERESSSHGLLGSKLRAHAGESSEFVIGRRPKILIDYSTVAAFAVVAVRELATKTAVRLLEVADRRSELSQFVTTLA